MKQLTIEEVRVHFLEVLDEIKRVCSILDINFFLMYGTLLGAVRHKGFIPWDDDVDIGLLRHDYDILITKFNDIASPKFRLRYYKNTKDYAWAFAKIFDTTTVIKGACPRPKFEYGLFVDVFPFDYVDHSTKEKRKKDFKIIQGNYHKEMISYTRFYVWRTKYKCICNFFVYPKLDAIKYFFIDHSRIAEEQDSYLKKNASGPSEFVRCGCYPPMSKRLVKTAYLKDLMEVDFCGHNLPIPVAYDSILTDIYGDYMTPPPENERVLMHMTSVFLKDQ